MLKEGAGDEVSKGNTVTVHATGIVKETGKKFWSTKDDGQSPFTCALPQPHPTQRRCLPPAPAPRASCRRSLIAWPRRRADQAGVNKVIKGWDQGCLGMKIGAVRKLDIPADEGYGARGFPAWGIPPNGGLLFEIEVLSIRGKEKAEL